MQNVFQSMNVCNVSIIQKYKWILFLNNVLLNVINKTSSLISQLVNVLAVQIIAVNVIKKELALAVMMALN